MASIYEVPRRRDLLVKIERLRSLDRDSRHQIIEHTLFQGEPISKGQMPRDDVEGHIARTEPLIEQATKRDIQARMDEQVERGQRMLEERVKLSPQWRIFLLNNAPEVLLDNV